MKLNRKIKKKSLLEFKENQKFTLLGSIRLRSMADSKFIPKAICKGFMCEVRETKLGIRSLIEVSVNNAIRRLEDLPIRETYSNEKEVEDAEGWAQSSRRQHEEEQRGSDLVT